MMYFLNQNYLPGSHKPLLWYRCNYAMSWGGVENIWLELANGGNDKLECGGRCYHQTPVMYDNI